MGIVDADGLAVYEAHKEFVAGVKAAFRQVHGRPFDPLSLSPELVGAEPLSFAMPPMMEEAFGYRGYLRFIEFGYGERTRQFGHSDGGDRIRSDPDLWIWFLRHPLVAPHLDERRYPTLYGVFAGKELSAIEELRLLRTDQKNECLEPVHCLLLDRDTRQPYICRRDQVMVFFPLTEPEDEDAHREFVNGLLISPENKDHNVPSPLELAERLRLYLDDQFDFMEGRASWPIGGHKHTVG
jgi:hypothetical protein